MKSESKRPITVEDLLRLKRAERPSPEFWSEFDRTLRAKQLSALLEKRPWWQALPRVFSGFSRYHLPIGATAILAVSVVSVRYFQSTNPVAVAAPAVEQPQISGPFLAAEVHAPLTTPVASGDSVRTGVAVVTAGPGDLSVAQVSSVAPALRADGASAGEPQPILPLLGVVTGEANAEKSPLGVRPLGATLGATVADSHTMPARGLLGAHAGFEARAMPSRPPIEPLQQMAPPAERSRSRLLTAMVSMANTGASARPGERVVNRLSEEQLYDQIHRFGARGAGVSMKF